VIDLDASSGHIPSEIARTMATMLIGGKTGDKGFIVFDRKNEYIEAPVLMISNEVEKRFKAVNPASTGYIMHACPTIV